MIYADAHMGYGQSWVILSLRPEKIRSVTENKETMSGWVLRWGSVSQNR